MSPPPVTLVDAHVHLHDCFAVADFLDTAAANFTSAARALGLQSAPAGCLMLTESQGVDHFATLAAGRAASGAWQLESTDEPVSLIARSDGAAPIALIAGRQIVCREGLEVLALGTGAPFVDGEPLEDVLKRVAAAGAITVLPWGVGKWQGARGRLIAQLIGQSPIGRLYLGDNGGRLGLAPEPAMLAQARSRGITVLPGSDPLSFPGQVSKVAGYGFVAEAPLDEATPLAALGRYLAKAGPALRRFGRLETLPGFLRAQVAMQLRKRRRQRAF